MVHASVGKFVGLRNITYYFFRDRRSCFGPLVLLHSGFCVKTNFLFLQVQPIAFRGQSLNAHASMQGNICTGFLYLYGQFMRLDENNMKGWLGYMRGKGYMRGMVYFS